MAELQNDYPIAAIYLSKIPKAAWAWHARAVPQYGYDTSNILESVNNVLRPLRKLQPLRMMDGIWTWLMGLIYERHLRPQRGVIVNSILTLFKERKIKAQRYKVFPSRNGIYQIQMPSSGNKYTVKLKKE